MPRKKKDETTVKKQKEPASGIKTKSLFDHINMILQIQDVKYFDKINEADKKTWSNYMINRFLSMNYDWVEIISELDHCTVGIQLDSKLMYLMYINIFPKSNFYLKYVKSQNEIKYQKELIDLVALYYEVSKSEAIDYLHIYFSTEAGIEDLKNVISKYGIEDKEIKKLIKI